MNTIGITGGSGFVGRHLAALLVREGYEVVIFTRSVAGKEDRGPVHYALCDPASGACDLRWFGRLEAVVNLAGAGIADRRWTKRRKQELRESRVDSTRFIVAQLRQHAPACRVFVSASATGYYGPDRAGRIPFTEDAPAGDDFLARLCRDWEAASAAASAFARTVLLRFGIVLGPDAGAFQKFARPVGLGIVPVLGSGVQMVSWIHVDDLAAMLLHALRSPVEGAFNAVAPEAVAQRQLVKAIAGARGGLKITVPVPAAVLRLALGEMAAELLKGCTVSSGRIAAAGFRFQYDTIDKAVRACLKISGRHSR